MNRFFLYKLTTDNGGAPCVTPDLLTLAICKPKVRSAADLRDWIFGFMDNPGENRFHGLGSVYPKCDRDAWVAWSAGRDQAPAAGQRLKIRRAKPMLPYAGNGFQRPRLGGLDGALMAFD